jgi:molybdopterin-containing oxidoreductase family iron-sulfur binding subunit
VRAFNWFDYKWDAPLEQQLNPEVTVRERGMMEKCTFCVQRIRGAQINAEDEKRPLKDGEVQPACAQSCPSEAIVFGDLDDPNSRTSRLAASGRAFKLLEDLGTKPKVVYLKPVDWGVPGAEEPAP